MKILITIYGMGIMAGFVLLLQTLGAVESEAYPCCQHIYLKVTIGYGLIFGFGLSLIKLLRRE